jgi:hypothetical protein
VVAIRYEFSAEKLDAAGLYFDESDFDPSCFDEPYSMKAGKRKFPLGWEQALVKPVAL